MKHVILGMLKAKEIQPQQPQIISDAVVILYSGNEWCNLRIGKRCIKIKLHIT